jgi:hypothetical protein
MFSNEVDEKPKFIYKEKEYLLFLNNDINPKYINLLTGKFKNSKILMQKAKGKVYIQFQISKSDTLDVRVLKVSGDQKDAAIIEKEILSIFNSLATYVSARNKGVSVDLWNKWALPIDFKI